MFVKTPNIPTLSVTFIPKPTDFYWRETLKTGINNILPLKKKKKRWIIFPEEQRTVVLTERSWTGVKGAFVALQPTASLGTLTPVDCGTPTLAGWRKMLFCSCAIMGKWPLAANSKIQVWDLLGGLYKKRRCRCFGFSWSGFFFFFRAKRKNKDNRQYVCTHTGTHTHAGPAQ